MFTYTSLTIFREREGDRVRNRETAWKRNNLNIYAYLVAPR
jgi:hypothetical protein